MGAKVAKPPGRVGTAVAKAHSRVVSKASGAGAMRRAVVVAGTTPVAPAAPVQPQMNPDEPGDEVPVADDPSEAEWKSLPMEFDLSSGNDAGARKRSEKSDVAPRHPPCSLAVPA